MFERPKFVLNIFHGRLKCSLIEAEECRHA